MAQVAVIPLCDICDAEDNRWFCTDCQIKLCERCKIAHHRIPKTKNDNIIRFGQVHQETQGNVVPMLCKLHKTKLCELYCHTCEKLICLKCLSIEHKAHGFDSIDDLVDSKISELNIIETKFKGKLSSYNIVLANEGKEHYDYMMHIDHLEVEVKGQTEKIVKEFYNLRDKQLSELLALKKDEEKRYRARYNQYQSRLTDIKKTVESVQKAKFSGNAAMMIQVVKKAAQSYQSLDDPTVSNLPRPEYEYDKNPGAPPFLQLQGRLHLPAMKVQKSPARAVVPTPKTEARAVFPKRVIDMNNVKVRLRIKIKGKTGIVWTVIPTDNNMAWVAVDPDNHLSLVDTEGRIAKKSVKVSDEIYHAVSYDGDILVVHANSHRVMRFSNDGDSVSTFSDLFPFYPNGLCVTKQHKVMVSLVSSLTRDNKLKSKIVMLNHQGHVIQEIQCNNQKSMFDCASTVTSLPTGDVVVVDNKAKDVHALVCLNESGNCRYTWSVADFWPARLTHDGQNVYITDVINHCVYVLDMHGKAEQFMLDGLGITHPAGISIDSKGRMWIGCGANIYILQ